jgi:hypothetical protein
MYLSMMLSAMYAECHKLVLYAKFLMLNVIMLSIMLSVMLSGVILNVIKLSVVMLSVVAFILRISSLTLPSNIRLMWI